VTVLDDRIMIIGGRGPMGTTAEVEIYLFE
jgi:hypothetical protein